jgi:hypothetical protein
MAQRAVEEEARCASFFARKFPIAAVPASGCVQRTVKVDFPLPEHGGGLAGRGLRRALLQHRAGTCVSTSPSCCL